MDGLRNVVAGCMMWRRDGDQAFGSGRTMKAGFAITVALAVILAACTGTSGPRQTTGAATSAQIASPTATPANPLSAVRRPIESLRPRVIAEIDVGGAPQ